MSEVIEFPKSNTARPAEPSRIYTTAPFVWLHAVPAKDQRRGRFVYVVGINHWPLSKLFTYDLSNARAAAESFGVPVKEAGPPEAFGRKEEAPAPPAESTIAAFWHVIDTGNLEHIKEWLRDHRADAPALLRLLEAKL